MQVTHVKRDVGKDGLIKRWTNGVAVDEQTLIQAEKVAKMPFIYKHVALMPDCHLGKGATVGSVIPTKKAIIPAAVGVDLGCGMIAAKLSTDAADLPDHLGAIRAEIEKLVPVGNGRGGEFGEAPTASLNAWRKVSEGFDEIISRHPKLRSAKNPAKQVGTLGGGNHFIEVCLDEEDNVWLMLHSGSRGIGNKIGTYFISKAKEEMLKANASLPDRDLAYLTEGTQNFDDYWNAVKWAQQYAALNREVMLARVLKAVNSGLKKKAKIVGKEINCHHNYASLEHHFGEDVYVTRKGAISAREGEMGIIPGSMGARSYIVRGLGNPQSFSSCSHGAGRVMSRSEAKRRFSVKDHVKATEGVECKKDASVLDETPGAYKNIDAVMAAQADLVEPVYRLKQVVCVKG